MHIIIMQEPVRQILVSKATKQKVQAAKNFIEQRYSGMLVLEQQKKQYWDQLNRKMSQLGLSQPQQERLKTQINHDEAVQLRQDRKKLSIYDFKPIRIIGKGAFGEVRLCQWKNNSEPVAVKKLKKSQMIYKNKVMQSRQQRNVLAHCEKNPWVVTLKCSFQDPDNLYLVMQYLPGGDLMNLLMKKDIFTHQQAQFYTAQILLSLQSVHAMKYIHRDLKPDNVLLDAQGHIKLSDFGLCKHTQMRPKKLTDALKRDSQIKKPNDFMRKDSQSSLFSLNNTLSQIGKDFPKRNRKLAYTAVGTPDYVAPQVQGKMGYTQTVDWWSMGVILFQMLVGYPPFASQTPRQTWFKIQHWKKYFAIPPDANVSPQAADLIKKLVTDPKDRLGLNGVQQIKSHAFFNGINWQKLRQRKSPYIPQVKDSWDTQNFDPFEQQQPWFPSQMRVRGRKKNPEFIGYTYKPVVQSNSVLVKALLDLQNYQSVKQQEKIRYVDLQSQEEYHLNSFQYFQKKEKISQRLGKDFWSTTALNSKKNQEKEKERYTLYYKDTPQKKQSPRGNGAKKSPKALKSSPKGSPKRSPKRSPKQTSKVSPSNKNKEERASLLDLKKKLGQK